MKDYVVEITISIIATILSGLGAFAMYVIKNLTKIKEDNIKTIIETERNIKKISQEHKRITERVAVLEHNNAHTEEILKAIQKSIEKMSDDINELKGISVVVENSDNFMTKEMCGLKEINFTNQIKAEIEPLKIQISEIREDLKQILKKQERSAIPSKTQELKTLSSKIDELVKKLT